MAEIKPMNEAEVVRLAAAVRRQKLAVSALEAQRDEQIEDVHATTELLARDLTKLRELEEELHVQIHGKPSREM